MKSTTVFKVIVIVIHFAVCLTENTVTKLLTDDDTKNDKLDRTRREINDFEELKPENEKRQREFIGKRFVEFEDPLTNEDDMLDLEGEVPGPYLYDNLNKRMRDFVGKRSYDGFEEDKRMRDFVGKRSFEDMEKRQREFVGKRSPYIDNDYFNKRMRDFVGKRTYDDDYSYLVNRLREFVSKRFTPDGYYRILRQPKYERELIGKRSTDSYVDDGFTEDKRLREFVGKRMRDFIGK